VGSQILQTAAKSDAKRDIWRESSYAVDEKTGKRDFVDSFAPGIQQFKVKVIERATSIIQTIYRARIENSHPN
jgi:hypothetical protein